MNTLDICIAPWGKNIPSGAIFGEGGLQYFVLGGNRGHEVGLIQRDGLLPYTLRSVGKVLLTD